MPPHLCYVLFEWRCQHSSRAGCSRTCFACHNANIHSCQHRRNEKKYFKYFLYRPKRGVTTPLFHLRTFRFYSAITPQRLCSLLLFSACKDFYGKAIKNRYRWLKALIYSGFSPWLFRTI